MLEHRIRHIRSAIFFTYTSGVAPAYLDVGWLGVIIVQVALRGCQGRRS